VAQDAGPEFKPQYRKKEKELENWLMKVIEVLLAYSL
jgi:hypothetical protein